MRITAFAMLLVVAGSAHAQPTNRPTSSPVTAPVKDEAAQRKLDDAAAAGQQKLADEKLARTEAQWKKVMRSICTGC